MLRAPLVIGGPQRRDLCLPLPPLGQVLLSWAAPGTFLATGHAWGHPVKLVGVASKAEAINAQALMGC